MLNTCNAPAPLQIEVTIVAAGRTWYFEADCWLDTAAAKSAAGRAELLLTASSSNFMADRKTYQVGAPCSWKNLRHDLFKHYAQKWYVSTSCTQGLYTIELVS
jgi:hypothetical protein